MKICAFSYRERWRDWPDEARQPAMIDMVKVPIPAGSVFLTDERKGPIDWETILSASVERIFYIWTVRNLD